MRVGEAIECTVTTRTAILALFCMQCLLWDSYSRLKADVKVLQEGQVPASSSTRMKRDTYKEANVEFIHPKLREEMGSQKGDPENPWVWLTSYSRIPLEAIQDFCAATKEYCPPGAQGPRGENGLPGPEGLKGKRGRNGRMGAKGSAGHRGPIGPPGPRGEKGDRGKGGYPGLDGRDGLPGEPGLDGVPGRNGLDGVSGIDGIPGLPGSPGVPGTNGKDGLKGALGPRGTRGLPGERGLPGPRGRPGANGDNGAPGKPGVSLWKVEGEAADGSGDVILVPPAISGGPNAAADSVQKIIVEEGDHLKLSCAATGIPKPLISWNRIDGNAYPDGSWRKSNAIGSTLNITRINRKHMGQYQCEANNGIPPSAFQIFEIEVHFSPLIRIFRQMLGGYIGSSVVLECTVEAYPNAVNYWERYDGKLVQERPDKYRISTKEFDHYKTTLSLAVTLTDSSDFGAYYCISKNDKGLTKGGITLFERDPNSKLPPPLIGGFRPTVMGEEPPPFIGLDDLCPPQTKCPDCAAVRCEGSARMYGLTILPYDSIFPGLPNRTEECMVETIGKPVFHRYSGDLFGSWLIDAYDYTEDEEKSKIWVTSSEHNRTLYEFSNKTMFRSNKPTKNYSLPLPFTGNDHVIYNGTFFYYNHFTESIVRYQLNTKSSQKVKIPRNRVVDFAGGELLTRLYRPQQEDSYFDFSTDENGLWGVFGLALDNNTVVMKFDSNTLEIHYMWNISLNHQQIADSFIVCGVMYAVDHVDERNTKIRFALDLYKNKLLDLELPFTNPFSYTTMLGYNSRLQSLTTWDGGNQLTYPIKYHAIGYKENDGENEANSTGYSLMRTEPESGLRIVDSNLEIE